MDYYTILTDAGRALEAAALAGERTYTLAACALGDGGDMPDPTRTALQNEVWRGPINTLAPDFDNPTWLVIETHVPPEAGGFTIREFGIYTDDGTLFAIGNYPETYKPKLENGTGIDLLIRPICQVSNPESVTLLIDPSVVMASRKYVDEQLKKVPRRNVGEVFYYQGDSAPYGAVIADGALLSRAIYPDLWAFAQNHGRVITEAEWQTKAGTESSVGFYSDGDGSTTFRAPKLVDYLRATDDPASVGQWQGDAIRNITGSIQGRYGSIYETGEGAFNVSEWYEDQRLRAYEEKAFIVKASIDASRVVPVAGENRPKTIRLLACIHAFDAIIPKAQADMHNILTVLNGKEDRIRRSEGNQLVIYVRKDGSDANDGLADTPSQAVATIMGALNRAQTYDLPLDTGINPVIVISIGEGEYEEAVDVVGFRRRYRQFTFRATNPASRPVVSQKGNVCLMCRGAVYVDIQNIIFRAEGSVGNCVYAQQGASVGLGNGLSFIGHSAQIAIAATSHAYVRIVSGMSFEGGFVAAMHADLGGVIQTYTNVTNTVSCTNVVVSDSFVKASMGAINIWGMIFTGNVTGRRYCSQFNGVIQCHSGGEEYFPGTEAGVCQLGGVYA